MDHVNKDPSPRNTMQWLPIAKVLLDFQLISSMSHTCMHKHACTHMHTYTQTHKTPLQIKCTTAFIHVKLPEALLTKNSYTVKSKVYICPKNWVDLPVIQIIQNFGYNV